MKFNNLTKSDYFDVDEFFKEYKNQNYFANTPKARTVTIKPFKISQKQASITKGFR